MPQVFARRIQLGVLALGMSFGFRLETLPPVRSTALPRAFQLAVPKLTDFGHELQSSQAHAILEDVEEDSGQPIELLDFGFGHAETPLPPFNPLLADRSSEVTIRLVDPAMDLADATGGQLALGANRALLGEVINQFARAQPLCGGRLRLTQLFRGRGGTEKRWPIMSKVKTSSCAMHGRSQSIRPDSAAVRRHRSSLSASATTCRCRHASHCAPSLCGRLRRGHPRVAAPPDGALELSWPRRARGAWTWPDGVDAPLHEQAERHLVTLSDLAALAAVWEIGEPRLVLSPETLAALAGGELNVRQQGSLALSEPLFSLY